MTPFLQFQLWLRRGPRSEHAVTAVALVVLLVLVAWAAVPVADDDEQLGVGPSRSATGLSAEDGDVQAAPGAGSEASGDQRDAATTSGPGAVTSGPTGRSGSATAGTPPPRGSSGAVGGSSSVDSCSGLGASDQGVDESEVFVAVPLINLGGDVGNETFGIRSDLEEVAQAVNQMINDNGGVACRQMRIKTYRVNPLDENEQRARCLEMVEDKPFAVIDFAGYLDTAARSCFPEHQLPYEGATSVTEEEVAEASPYMYSALASSDRQLRNWVFESAARGFFHADRGFRKLGLLLNSCNPGVNEQLKQNLTEVGVGPDKQSTFTLSCATVVPPSEISQAVVKHHNQDDVSHVLLAVPLGNAQSYVREANNANWKPVYGASDFGTLTTSSGAEDWNDSFADTVAITSSHQGELNSEIVNDRVVQCRRALDKAGVPPPTHQGDAAYALCDMFRLFAAAINNLGANPTRATLLDGLARVGTFETSNWGDGIYDRPGKVTGGDFIRPIQWTLDCRCWRVLAQEFKPGH